ncbi:MAG: hypothetical protein JO081_11645, partial [Alphaproteobacteria bacterium]|nr:hypothetical protein [Alphaproteobacteria bacterium]
MAHPTNLPTAALGRLTLSAALACMVAVPQPVAHAAVTAAAIFRPDAGFLARFHRQCDGRTGAAFDACFAAAMAKASASREALEFTRRLGNQAYLQAFDPAGGPIAIAQMVYP